MGAIIMKIDFATLAFGHKVKVGGSTPNWATALGQGKEHKINNDTEIDELLRGMIYSAVPLERVSTKIGKGGNVVYGNVENSPVVLAALFKKVYINDVLIKDGQYILLITRDTSMSHAGRLRVKYGTSNTYYDGENIYSNDMFIQQMKKQLGLGENACWFVSEISIRNQDELIFKATIVNTMENVEYDDTKALHAAWESLCPTRVFSKGLTNNEGVKNRIIFGAPGTGKSYRLNRESEIFGGLVERVTFHPNYSYSQFVGTYKPIMEQVDDGKNISYEFVPGPFMRTYVKAKKDIVINEYLKGVIENQEVNYFFESANNIGEWNLFQEITAIGQVVNFHATKDMKIGDIAFIYIGNNNYGYVPGVYAIATVISEPFMEYEEDGELMVELRFDKISYDKPLISKEEFEKYNTQVRSVHVINDGQKLLENMELDYIQNHLLLIEEINRANVAAVFGDTFQLLDRKLGTSEYPIATSEDIRKYLEEEFKGYPIDCTQMAIPSNMFIWATMNSADQGVFPMDTAFKRRWEFEYIGINDEMEKVEEYIIPVGMGENRKHIKWNELRIRINDILLSDECRVNEDKLLGPFFISKNMLENALLDEDKFVKAFESKVIMYLFEDVMKMRPANIFKGHNGKMIFSDICKTFEAKGEELFGINDIEDIQKQEQE